MKKEDLQYYYSEHKHNKRFVGTFLMFAVIAVTLGFLLAFIITTSNSIKEARAEFRDISGRAIFSLQGLPSSEEKIDERTQIYYNCSRINVFRLADLHDVFSVETYRENTTVTCQKVVYNRAPERVEVTYFGNRYNAIRQKDVAVLEYKCFINNTLYNYQFVEIAPDDFGFFADILKLNGYIAHGFSKATIVMPERYDDYCLRD
ncbi:MAG: hypothetical protein QXQ82_03085 [Candidatus Pacearchaeota archaeon]